jgi:hypothetical protein
MIFGNLELLLHHHLIGWKQAIFITDPLTYHGIPKEVITLIRVLTLSLFIDQKIIEFPILQSD